MVAAVSLTYEQRARFNVKAVMVALWMIRLHELEEHRYNAKMRSFAREGEYHQVRVRRWW